MTLVERVQSFAKIPEPENGQRRSFWSALSVQMRVTTALMLREALSRYGHENLGFFWLMGEPLAFTCGVMVMWTIADMGHGHGVGVVPFALTGYTMLTLWRHVVGHMGHAIHHSAGLMFHRNVKILDILLSHAILESIGGFAAFVIAYIPLYLFGSVPMISDPLTLIGGWVLITWLAFSFGIIVAALSYFNEAVARFIPPLLYITLPATGAFYMLNWMPEKTQVYLQWSPLVHPFELFRDGLLGPSVEAKFNVPFMILVCTVLTAIGVALVRIAEKRVHVQ